MTRVAELLLAAVLVGGAIAKLLAPGSRRALASLGVAGARRQWVAWAAAAAAELAIGVLIVAGLRWALLVAAGLFAAFGLVLSLALRRGRGGRPCGCFGSRGRVSWAAIARSGALAVSAIAVFAAPSLQLSQRSAMIVAFAVVGTCILALAVAVLALAREVGVLRLALQSRGALEIPEEGPALGAVVDVSRWVAPAEWGLMLAVFVSPGCPACQTLGPSLTFLRQDPWLALAVFDEEHDRPAWDAFAAPGAPYAVALDPEGRVLAKGLVNSLPQLESVIATAARRRQEPAHA